MFANVIEQEHPTRLVIHYVGRGSQASLFEDTINGDDAEKFFTAVKRDIETGAVILDLSTNCQVGFFEFVSRYAKHVDYILASEKNVGDFDIPRSDTGWTSDLHDYIYDQFWKPENSIDRAFDEIIAARRRLWQREADGIRNAGHDKEQSVAIYYAKQLQPLVTALHQIPVADLETIPLQHSSDIGTFIYDRKDAKLIRLFEGFRIRYASSRDVVPWDDDSRGLSTASARSLIGAP